MARAHRSRYSVPVLLGAGLVLLALWVQHTDFAPVRDLRNRLEWVAYDLRFDLTRPFAGGGSERVVIVDIDEQSLAAEGRWPWPRAKMANLMDRLFESGAVVVGLDTVFAEPERNPALSVKRRLRSTEEVAPPTRVLEALDRAAPALDGDRELARALGRGEAVLGYMLGQSGPRKGNLGPPLPVTNGADPGETAVPTMNRHLGNLPRLQEAATSAGYFSILPDADGILRRYHLLMGHDGAFYPSLALEMARVYLLAEEVEVETARVGASRAVDSLEVGGLRVPTNGHGAVLVPYRGEARSFPYISATDVLSGKAGPDRLAGKLVLVGSSAPGIYDLRATPVQNVFPGVEVHANVLRGLLQERFPLKPSWTEGANFSLMLGLGLILAFALPRLRPLWLAAVTVALALTLVGANIALWTSFHWVIPLALPLLLVLALGTTNMAYGFLFAEHGRRQLQDMFGQYVPPALVEEMVRDPDSASSMAGERREMTVLFADIRGFTAISEQLTAAELKDLLNRFFTPMTRLIFEHRGTIDKYVGDMIMAFWGAPLDDPDHARHGVRAALAMRDEAERLRERFVAEGFPEVAIGAGLNSGPMNVGNMGSEFRRSYTVLGDAVNLGSRLEGLTKFYGADIVISEATAAGLADEFLLRRLDRVQVKGREEPLTIYEPLCPLAEAGPEQRAEAEAHERALEAYWGRDWETARRLFGDLAGDHPQTHLYWLFLERMAETDPIADLPADWDGVYRHQSK